MYEKEYLFAPIGTEHFKLHPEKLAMTSITTIRKNKQETNTWSLILPLRITDHHSLCNKKVSIIRFWWNRIIDFIIYRTNNGLIPFDVVKRKNTVVSAIWRPNPKRTYLQSVLVGDFLQMMNVDEELLGEKLGFSVIFLGEHLLHCLLFN